MLIQDTPRADKQEGEAVVESPSVGTAVEGGPVVVGKEVLVCRGVRVF